MKRIAIFSERKSETVYWNEVVESNKEIMEVVLRTSDALTVESAQTLPSGTDGVIILPHAQTDAAVIKVLKEKGVKVISMRSVGLDSIDLDAASLAEIGITNVPAYSPQAIAEAAFYFILAGLRNMKLTTDAVMVGNFAGAKKIGHQVNTRKIGIYGYGHIGQNLAKLFAGFGTEVIAYIPNLTKAPENTMDYVTYEDNLDIFLQTVDVISMHIPLTEETHHLIDGQFISKMKAGSVIVNTARGGLVDTAAMLDALDRNQLSFYGTDVYEFESTIFNEKFESLDAIPDELFKKLVKHPQVMLTPHTAYNTYTSVENMVKFGFTNTMTYLDK